MTMKDMNAQKEIYSKEKVVVLDVGGIAKLVREQSKQKTLTQLFKKK